MKPVVVRAENESACIMADSLDDAMVFARSYFGDYRVDYRNENKVEFDRETGDAAGCRYFHFTVIPR